MVVKRKPPPPERDTVARVSLARSLTPQGVRWVARLVFAFFISIPFILALVPWQQTVMCRGTIVAYQPIERMQLITSRVSGQV
ncbi:MAG: hypothetical protein ACKO1M_12600, partial [Planctomycetota bacterium]